MPTPSAFSAVATPAGSGGSSTGARSFAAGNTQAATPVVTSSTSTVQTGQTSSYQIVASNAPTSYTATNLPTGASINTSTGLISFPAFSSSATYSIPIYATNAYGTGTATLTLSVTAVPRITTLVAAASIAFRF